MSVPFLAAANVYAALDPREALEAVRRAFLEHASGRWFMPSKVYVPAPPDGDFRAMPASGGGYAALKWVTSFPRNPERGLPTVAGVVLLSDATTGQLQAILDAGARPEQAEALAEELGPQAFVAGAREEAVAADVVATVTPGAEVVIPAGSLRPGQHVSLMGADGPGKAEIAVEELLRARVVCDEWEQASHNGDIASAVEAGRLGRDDVAQIGDVLAGTAEGRQSEHDITVFDSTGLAIQDLGVAIAIHERWRADPNGEAFAEVIEIQLGLG